MWVCACIGCLPDGKPINAECMDDIEYTEKHTECQNGWTVPGLWSMQINARSANLFLWESRVYPIGWLVIDRLHSLVIVLQLFKCAKYLMNRSFLRLSFYHFCWNIKIFIFDFPLHLHWFILIKSISSDKILRNFGNRSFDGRNEFSVEPDTA